MVMMEILQLSNRYIYILTHIYMIYFIVVKSEGCHSYNRTIYINKFSIVNYEMSIGRKPMNFKNDISGWRCKKNQWTIARKMWWLDFWQHVSKANNRGGGNLSTSHYKTGDEIAKSQSQFMENKHQFDKLAANCNAEVSSWITAPNL